MTKNELEDLHKNLGLLINWIGKKLTPEQLQESVELSESLTKILGIQHGLVVAFSLTCCSKSLIKMLLNTVSSSPEAQSSSSAPPK